MALNTLFGAELNFYLLLGENQQLNQSMWLEDILTHAVINEEKVEYTFHSNQKQVIIVGNLPPGWTAVSGYSRYASDYLELAERFSDVIVGHFFGYLA